MHRNLNHHFNNGNAQRRPDPTHHIRTSLAQHLKEKWLTAILGCVCFVSGIVLIVHNEAVGVKVKKVLEETISLVSVVSPESEIDRSNIGKLVYITGVMTIHEPLTEVDYGISVLAVRLARNVQMYQWVEEEIDIHDSEGNTITTNYHYHTEWQNKLIDSSRFATPMGHWNPKEFPIKKQTQMNENVKIGNYFLGTELKKEFTNFIPITSDERPERQDIKLHSGLYYHSQDLWYPEVGDVRIQFSYAGQHGQVLTIVAMLDENLTLVPYTKYADTPVLMLRLGQYSVEDMFAFVHSHNKFRVWMYRGGGWFLIYFSCICLSQILHIMVSYSPFLQSILPVTHSSINMTVSMCVTILATSLSWVLYRPVLGFGLIVVMILFLVFNKYIRRPQAQYNRL